MKVFNDMYSSMVGDKTTSAMRIGIVVSANDPQQMGRLQVMVPAMGHTARDVENRTLPWANYCSAYGGVNEPMSRGTAATGQVRKTPYGYKTNGPVAYGLWAIPRKNSRVILFSVEGDINQLYWIGCIYPNSMTHTLPHGRFSTKIGNGLDGPFSTTEQPIEPYYSKSTKAFKNHDNYEWRSRGCDYSVSAIHPKRAAAQMSQNTSTNLDGTLTEVVDDRTEVFKGPDGKIIGKDLKYRQGYSSNRIDPDLDTTVEKLVDVNCDTDENIEPNTISLSSPGFHAISLDDRPENCRMRFRTTSGHQIILDDTNERIYLSTEEGRNWIEMDSDGHIYVYSEENVNIRAAGDLNFTADKTIRLNGKEGIHLTSEEGDIRVTTGKSYHLTAKDTVLILATDIEVKTTSGNIEINTLSIKNDSAVIDSTALDIKSSNVKVGVGGTMSVKSSNFKLDSGGNIKTTGDITSSEVSVNNHQHEYIPGSLPPTVTIKGPGNPGSASPADAKSGEAAEDAQLAYFTNIVPDHEPWARVWMKNPEDNVVHEPEFDYDSPNVGVSMKKSGVEDDRERNPLWRR